MRAFYLLVLVVVAASAAFGDDTSDRAKLTGTWQILEGDTTGAVTYTLDSTSDTVKVTQSQNGQKVSEFKCNASGNAAGKECDMSDGGHKAKVLLWFSGSKLVEIETKGAEVVKRTFSVAPKDDSLEVEITSVVPGGKSETQRFHRAELTAARR